MAIIGGKKALKLLSEYREATIELTLEQKRKSAHLTIEKDGDPRTPLTLKLPKFSLIFYESALIYEGRIMRATMYDFNSDDKTVIIFCRKPQSYK